MYRTCMRLLAEGDAKACVAVSAYCLIGQTMFTLWQYQKGTAVYPGCSVLYVVIRAACTSRELEGSLLAGALSIICGGGALSSCNGALHRLEPGESRPMPASIRCRPGCDSLWAAAYVPGIAEPVRQP
jgi:hypothetical protein